MSTPTPLEDYIVRSAGPGDKPMSPEASVELFQMMERDPSLTLAILTDLERRGYKLSKDPKKSALLFAEMKHNPSWYATKMRHQMEQHLQSGENKKPAKGDKGK